MSRIARLPLPDFVPGTPIGETYIGKPRSVATVRVFTENGHYFAVDEYDNTICQDSPTSCIQEAINYVYSRGGGKIKLRRGLFVIKPEAYTRPVFSKYMNQVDFIYSKYGAIALPYNPSTNSEVSITIEGEGAELEVWTNTSGNPMSATGKAATGILCSVPSPLPASPASHICIAADASARNDRYQSSFIHVTIRDLNIYNGLYYNGSAYYTVTHVLDLSAVNTAKLDNVGIMPYNPNGYSIAISRKQTPAYYPIALFGTGVNSAGLNAGYVAVYGHDDGVFIGEHVTIDHLSAMFNYSGVVIFGAYHSNRIKYLDSAWNKYHITAAVSSGYIGVNTLHVDTLNIEDAPSGNEYETSAHIYDASSSGPVRIYINNVHRVVSNVGISTSPPIINNAGHLYVWIDKLMQPVSPSKISITSGTATTIGPYWWPVVVYIPPSAISSVSYTPLGGSAISLPATGYYRLNPGDTLTVTTSVDTTAIVVHAP